MIFIEKYYSQQDIVTEIKEETGFTAYQVERVFEALKFIVTDKLGDKDNKVTLKLLPGLILTSEVVPNDDHSKLHETKQPYYKLRMSARLTDKFRQKIRRLHDIT